LSWVFAVVLLVVLLVISIYLRGLGIFINLKIKSYNCKQIGHVPKKQAYLDLKAEKSVGLFHCYCLKHTHWTSLGSMGLTFEEFNKLDTTPHCLRYQILQQFKTLILFFTSTSPVLLNELLALVFLNLSKYLRTYLKSEE